MRGNGFTFKAVALAAAGLLTLGACAESSSGTAGEVDAAGLSAAKAAAEKDRATPQFKAPGAPVDIASLKGKTVFFLPIQETDAGAQIKATMEQITKEAGVNFVYYANQGAVSDWVKGMQAAIAQNVDVIMLDGVDPRQLQPQIQNAKDAGIPVVVAKVYDVDDPNPPACDGCGAGVTALVKAPLSNAGRASANWAIADSEGKADVLIVTLNGLSAADSMTKATEAAYKKNCPSCKVKVVKLDLTQVGKAGGFDAVSTALAQDPNINYVNPMFDPLISGTTAAVRTANRADKVKMMSYNGSQAALELVKAGNTPLVMDIAEPVEWVTYAYLDQIFRALAGMDAVEENTPIRVLDTNNIKEAGDNFADAFGDSYIDGYRKLWGLN